MRITDQALSGPVPADAEAPDIDAKLAGLQKTRGWGLFLIRAMVDDMDVTTDGTTQTVTLTLVREEQCVMEPPSSVRSSRNGRTVP